MELPFDLPVQLLRLYPNNPETPAQKNLCTRMFIALFTIAKCWKQPMCPPVNKWIKKQWYTYKWNPMQQKEGAPTLCDMELRALC